MALAALIQIHYSALWLIPVSVVWLIAFARRLRLAPVIVTALIGAVAFAPFVIADGLRGWPSVTRLLAMVQQPATTDTTAFHLAQITTTGEEIHSLAGPQEFENYRALVPFNDGVSALIGLLVLGGSIIAAFDVLVAVRQRRWDDRSAASFLLVTWLLLPVFAQLSHRTPLYVHYFIIVLPAPFMLIGYLIGRLPDRHWLKAVGIVGIAVITVAQAYQVIVLQQFVGSRPTPGGMSIPIGYYERIVNVAKDALKQSGGSEIIVNTRGSNINSDEYPAIFNFLLNEVPHRFVDVNQAMRVYPSASHIQIDYAPDGPTTFAEAGRDLVGEITLRAGEQPGRVYRSSGYTESTV